MSSNPLGSCYGTPIDYLGIIWTCLVSKDCVDYVVVLLKVVAVMLLPIFFHNEQRVVIHSLINIVTMEKGEPRIQGNFSLICAAVVLVGTYVLMWDLGNGDGFLGPVKRARARGADGKFL